MGRDFGGVVRGGKVVFDDSVGWTGTMVRLEGKRVTVNVGVVRRVRTIAQNKRYWSLLIPLFSDLTGYEKDEAHVLLKAMFLPVERMVGNKTWVVPGSTASLDTKEFSAYCDRVERLLNENGYMVPQAGEALEAAL